MLRDLGFEPWQYGLALGLPAAGGILGSLSVPRLLRRWPLPTVLFATGAARAVWLGAVPLAPPGTAGLVVIVAADTLLLACAGAFNTVAAVAVATSALLLPWRTIRRPPTAGVAADQPAAGPISSHAKELH